MSGLSNGVQAVLMLLAFILPVWIAWTANGSLMDRNSLSLVFSGSLGGILAFIKEILGGKAPETTTSTNAAPASPAKTQLFIRRWTSKFSFFMSDFAHDKTGRAGLHHRRSRSSGKYDPDPRRKRRGGHRKGVEPAGLKRWRLAHKTHDPGRASSLWKGPRGGHYFHGPHKNRYDPAPRYRRARQYFARHPRYRRVGGKIGGIFNKWGVAIGALIGGGIGFYQAYNDYNQAYGSNALKNYWNSIIGGPFVDKNGASLGSRTPEISKLWGTNDSQWAAPRGPLDYLKYKFLGQDQGAYKGSAWVYPFWIGFAATILRPIARLFTHKGEHILKPLQKVGIGMLGVSTVGALALPGCPKKGDVANVLPPPPNVQKPNVIQFTLGQNS
jgi:hypothetical protein